MQLLIVLCFEYPFDRRSAQTPLLVLQPISRSAFRAFTVFSGSSMADLHVHRDAHMHSHTNQSMHPQLLAHTLTHLLMRSCLAGSFIAAKAETQSTS